MKYFPHKEHNLYFLVSSDGPPSALYYEGINYEYTLPINGKEKIYKTGLSFKFMYLPTLETTIKKFNLSTPLHSNTLKDNQPLSKALGVVLHDTRTILSAVIPKTPGVTYSLEGFKIELTK